MAVLLILLGLIIALVGAVWLTIVTFQESVLWGVGSLVVPVVALAFVVMNWEAAKKPFLIQVAGVVLLIIGVMIAPVPHPGSPQ